MYKEEDFSDMVIYASEIGIEIWIGDDEGNFVQKGQGILKTRLRPGKYTVSFGLNGEKREVELKPLMRVTVIKD
jgi:hypothetical protein